VFVDSSAFYALLDPRDANRMSATAMAQRLSAEGWQLYTTNFVRAEAHALILNRFTHQAADRFLAQLRESSAPTLLYVTRDDEERALELITRYHDKNFSLVDATSFVIMERMGIPRAFTFDHNFTQYGLQVLTRP
jgi:predicted nucleic acid-binding protein